MIEVALLGAPRIERDGRTVSVDTRKAIALLAYLAVTGRDHTRDTLAALLWPSYDQEHARGALRRTLSTLRKALGPEWIESGRESIALKRGDGLRVDVDEFRALVSSEDPRALRRAVELYRGDFLAGFVLRDSPSFDDWEYFEGDTLKRELASALDRLAAEAAERGDHRAAIPLARRRLALNPLDEPAHRRLIELYARAGERAAAVRQYRECVRTLHRELGVPPVEETTALYRAIQESAPAGAPATPGPSAAAQSAPAPAPEGPPLVGRAAEWAALLGEHRRIATDGRLVVVEGEMGIGKTRLVLDVLASLSAAGAATIAVRCYEEERGLAFAPVAEAARTAVSLLGEPPSEAAEELGRLLPEVGAPSPGPLEGAGAQTRFFEALRRVLEAAVAGPRPGVLFFDDVHCADEASLDFLTYLVRRLPGRPMLVLFAWRSEEVPSTHRLRGLLAEGGRTGAATAVLPRRLTPDEVEELASALASADANADAARSVHRDTGGLPLFAVEYLLAVARGEAGTPPGSIRDLLRARISPASEVAAQVLTAAAVLGGRFATDTVREVAGRTEEEAVSALEELALRGLVEEVDGDHYDFRHEQVRTLVYEDASLARRRLLHGRVGDVLARGGAAGAVAAQVARHYQLAGRDAEAAERFLDAAEHARSLYAYADALAYLEAALALGHPEPGVVHEGIGDVQTVLGEYAAALASYEAAVADGAPGRAPALEHKLGGLHLRRGDLELAARHFEAALDALEPRDGTLRARVLADASLVADRRGDRDGALERAREALVEAEEAGDGPALAQAHNILGILLKSSGDRARAREHLELSLRWADEQTDLAGRIAALNNLALVDREDGDVGEAIARARHALELSDRLGDRHRQAALHNNLADLLHAAGARDEAMSHLKSAVRIFAEVGEADEPQPEIWKLVEW